MNAAQETPGQAAWRKNELACDICGNTTGAIYKRPDGFIALCAKCPGGMKFNAAGARVMPPPEAEEEGDGNE